MSKCETSGCPGHLGKFDSCRDEALYEIALDESRQGTGDCDYEGYATWLDIPQSELVTIDPDAKPVRQAWVPAGFYIVHTAPSGAVSVTEYESESDMMTAFNEFADRYAKWMDHDDCAQCSIGPCPTHDGIEYLSTIL